MQVGRFLGEVDGALMTQLLSMGVFSQVTMYDYQAMCRPPTHHHSASQPLVSVTHLCPPDGYQVAAHKHKKQDLLQPCDTAYPVFVHQTAVREASGTVECRACQKMRSQKLRRRPDTCHAFHPEENAQDCGGASDISASLPLLLLPLWAWVLPSRLLR
ncbi:hypothetical protein Celaphus_00013847 [Cervus elaphus hippelaphus]|uniref:Voltage-dependent calcium channel alpha-2/delta subunit conserved region domain-containing protein n=1 Tax=Cervus elaphus hippelaphus TaxID=46360 RepID=A0A212CCL4_CEREH|nr:hypothetical protein Celaphus_00013847 [Cervus elaphus hippelaphus]